MINNKPKVREKRFNDFLTTSSESNLENRYCRHHNVRLVHNPRNSPHDKYVYVCPRCNCGNINISDTQPEEKIMVTFPTHNASSATNKRLIAQPDSERLPRSTYFINKRMQEKNKIENEDPYLAILKQRNDITITNVEFFDAEED